MENKIGKYFKYAIGEIVLVVIGILIALSLNNWNTHRNEITKLNNVLNIVKTNFINDTLKISSRIKIYETKNIQILDLLENRLSNSSLDSVNELNYKNHFFRTRILGYGFFLKQNKGIELLKNMATNVSFEKDSLITSLIEGHSIFKLRFDEDNQMMVKINFQGIENFEKYSWFTDWVLRKYNRGMFQYFYGDDEIKGAAGKYYIYSKQFLDDLEDYEKFSKTYITLIEKRLNE